jgi:hypothetical protein
MTGDGIGDVSSISAWCKIYAPVAMRSGGRETLPRCVEGGSGRSAVHRFGHRVTRAHRVGAVQAVVGTTAVIATKSFIQLEPNVASVQSTPHAEGIRPSAPSPFTYRGRAPSSQRLRVVPSTAPDWRAIALPPWKRISVGMLRMAKRPASSWCSSVLTLPTWSVVARR